MDGWITVGTKMDTKQLDQDLKAAEKQMKQFQKEADNLAKQKAKVDIDLSSYEQEKQKIQETTDLILQQSQTQEQTNFILESENLELEKIKEKYSETFKKNEDINNAIAENVNKQNVLNNEIDQMSKKLNQVNTLKAIGSETNKVIKKVTKWGLAIFSIRSAYMFVRQSISTLSQYNKDMASNIQYMQYALANSLKPVIEWIIKAAYEILLNIGRIIYLITGFNIFKESGIKDFDNSLKNSVSSAKELKKQLAGFDEMNVLNDNGSVGAVGGISSSNVTLPDLSEAVTQTTQLEEAVHNYTDSLFEAGNEMKESLANPSLYDEAYGYWSLFVQGVVQSFVGIGEIFTGISEIIGGVMDIIVGIFTLDGEKILEGIKWVGKGIWDVIVGVWDFLVGILEMVIGLIIGICGEIWDGIKGLGLWIWEGIQSLWNSVVSILSGVGGWIYDHIIKPVGDFFSKIFSAIGKGVSDAWNGIINILSSVGSWIYDHIIKPVGDFFSGMWNGLKNGASQAWDGIKSVFSSVANFFKDIFGKAWEGVKKVFSTGGQIFLGIKDGIVNAFKKVVNTIIDGINKVIKIPFDGINSALRRIRDIDFWGWKPFDWISTIKVPQLPHLAKGGIISQPGRGVMLGQAIGGERGREGVIPLTDTQQMELLGEAIGKYINVQATIPIYVGNRQIAREIRNINTQNDFAFNK